MPPAAIDFQEGQGRLLELIARGAPLADALQQLARLIEAQCDGLRCAVRVLEAEGQPGRPAAGPPIGADPDAEAGWSAPIVSKDGALLGSVALLGHHARPPTADETDLLARAAGIAGIAIERQRHEDALQQAVLEQRAIFDNATTAIFLVKDRAIQRCNRRLEELLGYEPGELNGQLTRVYFPSDAAWEAFGEAAYARIGAGEGFVADTEIMRKDGSLIWTTAFGTAIDPADLSKGTVWVGVDISERKRTEEALQAALIEQRAIFDNVNGGIHVVRDRVTLRCNRGFEAMLGYGPGELDGRSTRMYFPSDEAYDEFGRLAYAPIAAGRPYIGEIELVRKDGERRWFASHGSVIDPQDPGKGTIWISHDVTERRRAEAALQELLLEQQALLDHSAIGIAFVVERTIVRVNGELERLLGYDAGEMKGRSTRVWYTSEEEYEAIGAALAPVARAGGVFSRDMQLVRRDGTRLWCSVHAKGIQADRPELGGVCVMQDISGRKQAEAALVAANERLARGLAEVEQTRSEISLLSELSSFLQACATAAEAHAAIADYAPRLFPGSAGALYLQEGDGIELMNEALRWGDKPLVAHFINDECWALRRTQPYRLDQPSSVRCCAHVNAGHRAVGPCACLPLLAQGKIFGLLYVEHAAVDGGRADARHRLAVALAEQSALALANIGLRETLRQQSIRDPLTGLYNRRFMTETIRRELARAARQGQGLAVAMIDVDHFKRFNDAYGHDAGDVVLQAMAQLLETHVRRSDVACRHGGEEFVLLLPGLSQARAEQRAQELLREVRALKPTHGGRPLGAITASIGLAMFPQHGKTPEALIEAADAALFRAKGAGRDRLVVG